MGRTNRLEDRIRTLSKKLVEADKAANMHVGKRKAQERCSEPFADSGRRKATSGGGTVGCHGPKRPRGLFAVIVSFVSAG